MKPMRMHMHHVEEHAEETETSSAPSKSPNIASEMVLVQQMTKKPGTFNTVKDLGHYINKQNNAMFLSGSKKQTVKVRGQSVDLKETRTSV